MATEQFVVDPAYAEGRSAALAADGDTSGLVTYTLTTDEASSWWQIDLGSSQDIGKVRVWNRDKKSCPGQACAQELTDFHVFLSDVDFSAGPPTGLADSIFSPACLDCS